MVQALNTLYGRIRGKKEPVVQDANITDYFPALTTEELQALANQRVTVRFREHDHDGILQQKPYSDEFAFVFRERPTDPEIRIFHNFYPADLSERARAFLIGDPSSVHRYPDGSLFFSGKTRGQSWLRPDNALYYVPCDNALRSVGL